MYFNVNKQEVKDSPQLFAMYPEKQNTPKQFLVYFAALAVGLCWAGWVFAALWEWFILPVIPVRQITVPTAIGIIITIGLLFGKSSNKKFDLTWNFIQDRIIDWTLRPLIALAVGAIVYAFV